MPAEKRSDEVGGAEDVKGAGEDGASDAVEDGEVPGYLGAVNGEVWRSGAVEALFLEDGGGGSGGRGTGRWGLGCGGCGESGEKGS